MAVLAGCMSLRFHKLEGDYGLTGYAVTWMDTSPKVLKQPSATAQKQEDSK